MSRRKFDRGLTWGAAVLTAVLLVAGILLFAGYSFANDQVTSQLAEQRIFFPEKGEATADPEIGPFIDRYSGQQLTTGEQAEAYANHYIAVHLKDVNDGKTYAETSAESRANPDDEELAGKVQTLFRGETLRGLLLTAYAFWKVGQIALIASVVAFGLGGVMFLLTIFGFVHLRSLKAREHGAPVVAADRALSGV